MCVCSLPLPPPSPPPQPPEPPPLSVLETWQWIVDDNLPHTEEAIREAAVSALTHLCARHYLTDPETIKKAQGDHLCLWEYTNITAEDFWETPVNRMEPKSHDNLPLSNIMTLGILWPPSAHFCHLWCLLSHECRDFSVAPVDIKIMKGSLPWRLHLWETYSFLTEWSCQEESFHHFTFFFSRQTSAWLHSTAHESFALCSYGIFPCTWWSGQLLASGSAWSCDVSPDCLHREHQREWTQVCWGSEGCHQSYHQVSWQGPLCSC